MGAGGNGGGKVVASAKKNPGLPSQVASDSSQKANL